MQVAHIPREQFLAEHWDWQPGEHVGFWEPTQGGKTHLAYQMLDVAMTRHPELRTVSLMPKSRDPGTWQWSERLGLKVVGRWPPPRPFLGSAPRGYVFWPPHLKNGTRAANNAQLADHFRRCLSDQYRRGDSVTLVDDVYLCAVLLGLNPELEDFWTAGGAGRASVWSTNQKPSGTVSGGSVSTFSYNAPTHLILGKDTDRRNRRRFSEIGGVDPDLVSDLVAGLQVHRIRVGTGEIKNISEKLYIHKGGPYLCVIGI